MFGAIFSFSFSFFFVFCSFFFIVHIIWLTFVAVLDQLILYRYVYIMLPVRLSNVFFFFLLYLIVVLVFKNCAGCCGGDDFGNVILFVYFTIRIIALLLFVEFYYIYLTYCMYIFFFFFSMYITCVCTYFGRFVVGSRGCVVFVCVKAA